MRGKHLLSELVVGVVLFHTLSSHQVCRQHPSHVSCVWLELTAAHIAIFTAAIFTFLVVLFITCSSLFYPVTFHSGVVVGSLSCISLTRVELF